MSDDHVAITNLVYAYAERIDAGDFDGVAALLADADVSGEGGNPVRGADAVRAMYERSTRRYDDDGTPKTKHVTTNLVVEVDSVAGRATCRSYFTVLQAVPGELALQPIIAGRYHDEFERHADAWRFSKRHMIPDLIGDLGHHLLFEL
ncbi:MAG TPA: nuclear transport factor 2 family protein [Acidimicrobiales bacterium]|nr:nuclear transport factor 2 family protein [Acidimicrobiales bacterium]